MSNCQQKLLYDHITPLIDSLYNNDTIIVYQNFVNVPKSVTFESRLLREDERISLVMDKTLNKYLTAFQV